MEVTFYTRKLVLNCFTKKRKNVLFNPLKFLYRDLKQEGCAEFSLLATNSYCSITWVTSSCTC